MGDEHASRTPAQLTNRLRVVAAGYERVWRGRSLTLLSGRNFPLREELDELCACFAIGDSTDNRRSIIVDLACSEGLYGRRLADDGALIVAIDHSQAFLRRVLRRRQNRPMIAVRALAQHLPLRNGAVDGIAIGGSLNEIGDIDGAIREASRIAREGARLFSMSLTDATTRSGRLVQRIAGSSGIVFPTCESTLEYFESNNFIADIPVRKDRVVLRIAATKRSSSASQVGSA